jgi:hypothetical protein
MNTAGDAEKVIFRLPNNNCNHPGVRVALRGML